MNLKPQKPTFFTEESVQSLKKENPLVIEIDAFSSALEELFFIENPQYKKPQPGVMDLLDKYLASSTITPVFIYYPWKNTVVKTVPENIYLTLRTARNRFIINQEEQTAYRDLHVAIAGLSVGSAILSSIVVSGGCKKMKIADFDKAEITNLNRMRAKLTDIGQNKTFIAAKEVWELDPYAEIDLWSEGISKDSLNKFLLDPKVDVFVDEMDSLDLKIAARFVCREAGIPVLMATDNGDGVILDVERFDLDKTQEIFHGLLGTVTPKDFENIDYKMWLQLATKIVGPTYLTPRMQESLSVIGRSIPSVPQLGTTANIAGAAVSFCLRRLSSKLPLESGRYTVSLEEKIIPRYMSEEMIKEREQNTKLFISNFGKK
ncbi:MAG: ThiF protein [Patescibacteria group bacterium]|jgi:molybdopterin/thiamine biosynthesis adenylyltransferase|nr:ThiF protein [Patescibacteria group bacterium]